MRTSLVIALCMSFMGCTHAYTPHEYPLAAERIPQVRASAPVVIVNVQHRVGEELLFAVGAHKWLGDHREITEHFAVQLSQALKRSGVQVVAGAAPKRLDVAVTSLAAWPAFYHHKAKAVVAVTTGDGQRFDIVAGNGSPGNIYRTLNGTLAIAVLETLKHPGVQAYLMQPVMMLVPAPAQPAAPPEAQPPQAVQPQAAATEGAAAVSP